MCFRPTFTASKRAALALYRRVDATLGDFYFTGGAPALSRYPLKNGLTLGAPQDLGELPGFFGDGANRPARSITSCDA